jgi:hypothetical protein
VLDRDYTGGIELHPPIVTSVEPLSLLKVNGEHRMEGILLAGGPMIKKNQNIDGAKLVDMAPTILYSQGLPIPENMDGVVLEELFTPEYLSLNLETRIGIVEESTVPVPESFPTPEEEEQMKAQLSRLGYL